MAEKPKHDWGKYKYAVPAVVLFLDSALRLISWLRILFGHPLLANPSSDTTTMGLTSVCVSMLLWEKYCAQRRKGSHEQRAKQG